MIPTATALRELDALLARESLADFSTLVSGVEYEQPPHVQLLIERLEALERGDIKRLIVMMPPRSSKSTHMSRLLPAWWLGRHPKDGVILASYSDTLAVDNGRGVRDLLTHPLYPFKAKLRADVKSAGRWQTAAGAALIAVGVGTGLTGWPFPGNLGVVDDPVKGREDAESAVVRNSTWTWWQETFLTRLAKGGAIVLGGTRWHEDDLIGRVLNSAGASDWEVLRLPYTAEADDALGREVGEKLPVFGSPPSVEKGEISAYGFDAQYEQRPTPAGGGVFKKEWMQRRYCVGHAPGTYCTFPDAKPLPPRAGRWRTIASYDLGGKPGVGHDPSAVAYWGWDGISKYLLDYWSDTVEFEDLKAQALVLHYKHRPWMHYVEDATWAMPLLSSLRRAGLKMYPVPTGNASKWSRADAVSGDFKGGQVALPCSAPWLDAWITEHTGFPRAKHDESVDTTSLALSVMDNAPGRNTQKVTEAPVHRIQTPSERILARVKERRARA
jgi:predicted phage terminase large subunit-like protein